MTTRGIIIAALERYEELLYSNIQNLRYKLKCELPIEIWQIGQEISNLMKQKLESNCLEWKIIFKNVQDYTDDAEHWRGYQIKAFILKHTKFDEVILCDCDSIFLLNPEIIYDNENYKNTGTYFFKDFLRHVPKNKEEEINRIIFINKLMPEIPKYLPEECYYLYNKSSKIQQMWFYQESGVVYINKLIHPEVIETIYNLNNNHKETYKYVHGDKEIYWISFLMNNKPFYMNNIPGINIYPNIDLPRLKGEIINNIEKLSPAFAHFYDKKIVYENDKSSDEPQIGLAFIFSQKAYPDISKMDKHKLIEEIKNYVK
jgi:hypothetical protein